MSDIDLDELRSELDEFAQPEKKGGRSAREERIIAGFEEIQRFVEKNGRAPSHGEDRDIFERLYAVRLDRLRALEECNSLLTPLDHQGILGGGSIVTGEPVETMDDDELFAELEGAAGAKDITQLRHVRTSADKRAAEEIANRQKCEDFELFKPLFLQIQADLDAGIRHARQMKKGGGEVSIDEIALGAFFIVGGQKAYVAEMGEEFTTEYDRRDRRLRVIYDNGTEAEVLSRSFQRSLHRDDAARRITDPSAGPLFDSVHEDGDTETGTIYVLRSKSDHPIVAANRNILHKIGVTGGSIESRIAAAKTDPTFLLAEVEIVGSYKLFNINRVKLENLLHRVFAAARVEMTIADRFGNPVQPREWFLVPLSIVDEAVERVRDQTIVSYVYDPSVAALVIR